MELGAGAVSGNLHRPARRPLLRAVFARSEAVLRACLNRYTAQIAALCSAERILRLPEPQPLPRRC